MFQLFRIAVKKYFVDIAFSYIVSFHHKFSIGFRSLQFSCHALFRGFSEENPLGSESRSINVWDYSGIVVNIQHYDIIVDKFEPKF